MNEEYTMEEESEPSLSGREHLLDDSVSGREHLRDDSDDDEEDEMPSRLDSYSRMAQMYRIEQLFRGKGLNMEKMAASVSQDPNTPRNGLATVYGPMDSSSNTLRRYGVETNPFVLVFSRNSGDIRVTYLMIEKAHQTILPRINNTSWVKLRGLTGYRVVTCENCVYVIGGKRKDSGYCINRVIRYDPVSERWKTCEPLRVPRCNFAVSVIGRTKILVSGGEVQDEDGTSTITNTTEMYDPYVNKWSVQPEMDDPLTNHACAGRDFEVYTCGGTTRSEKQGRNNLTMFYRQKPKDKPKDGPFQWKALPDNLPKNLSRHSITIHQGSLHIFGGVERIPLRPEPGDSSSGSSSGGDGEEQEEENPHRLQTSTSVFCYKLNNRRSVTEPTSGEPAQSWTSSEDMTQPRCDAGLVSTGNRIYVIGGHRLEAPDQPITDVDCYHVVKEKWNTVFSLDDRSYASVDCCVVDIPVTNSDFKCEPFTGTCKWVMW